MGTLEQATLVEQRTLAHEGKPSRLVIVAECLEPIERCADRSVGDMGHDVFLLQVPKEGDPVGEGAGYLFEPVGLGQFEHPEIAMACLGRMHIKGGAAGAG